MSDFSSTTAKNIKNTQALRDEYILTYRTHWKCFSLSRKFSYEESAFSVCSVLFLSCWNAAYFRKLELSHQPNWDLESRSHKLKFMGKARRESDPQVFLKLPHIQDYLSRLISYKKVSFILSFCIWFPKLILP